MALGVAIALVERCRGGSEVDECHPLLAGQLLRMIAIVHGMVIGRNLVARSGTIGSEDAERVAQVVTTVAFDFAVAAEIAAADGRADNGCGSHGNGLVDNLTQTFLIGGRGYGATLVDSLGCLHIALVDIVVVELHAVHAAVFLVVMTEGDDDVVACLYIILGSLPQFIVASARVATALGIVDACPAVGEEIAEVHSPAACYRGRLVIVGHGGVAQRVHLLSLHHDGAGQKRT